MSDYESTDHQQTRPGKRRLLPRKTGAVILATGLAVAMAGLVGTGTASAADLTSAAPAATTPIGGGAPRSGPEEGGATGIVDSVSGSVVTLTTATGVEVTADESATTKYKWSILPATPGVVRKGESVLVLGVVDSTTIAASEITVQPLGDGGATASAAAGVIAAQQGVPSPVKSVGTVPSDYVEGEGTIVSGTVADKAAAAAQAVVPGGVVDRVVQLSDGEYEVHNIAVNWPHHVFVSPNFTVLGYE